MKGKNSKPLRQLPSSHDVWSLGLLLVEIISGIPYVPGHPTHVKTIHGTAKNGKPFIENSFKESAIKNDMFKLKAFMMG